MFSNTIVNVIFAIVIVLGLIALAAWAVRRFASDRLGGHGHRGRMPRLAVIDAAPIDARRKLVLIRRDNIEHLIMIGGPSDIVIEPNIIRVQPMPREQAARPPAGFEAGHAPQEQPAWHDLDAVAAQLHEEPGLVPEPPPRHARPADESTRRAPSPPPLAAQPAHPERRPPPRRQELMSEFAPEPTREPMREQSREPRPEPRPGPMGRMFRPSAPAESPPKSVPRAPEAPRAAPREPAVSSADQNLAEMAQRLEAALRRSGAEPSPDAAESRGPNISAGPVDRIGAPPVAPEQAAPRAPSTRPAPPPAAAPKSEFESLEEEMASLLGRSKNPT
jgi:hypothetical protein